MVTSGPRVRSLLSTAAAAAGLALLAYLAMVLVAGPVGSQYDETPGFAQSSRSAQIGVMLAAGALFCAGVVVAVPVALRPAPWPQKLAQVLPLYLLTFALVAAISTLFGVGTLGNLASGAGIGNLTLARTWLALSVAVSTAAVAIAVGRANVGRYLLKAFAAAMAVAVVLSLVAALAAAVCATIVLTGEPSRERARAVDARTRPQPPIKQFAGGAFAMVLFAGVALICARRAARHLQEGRASSTGPEQVPEGVAPDYTRETGKIAVSFAAITAVVLLAIQALPISRTNPPVQTSVQWTSPETQQIWSRACADCHSNETRWPWYSRVAPSSWLTALHVREGRDEFNISELDRLPENRRRRLPEETTEQIERSRMPPRDYLILHPDARLSQAEKERFGEGLAATLSGAVAEDR